MDVTWASDAPGIEPGRNGEIKLGKGPVLCRSGVTNKKMNALLEEIAKEKNIPLQMEVAGGDTFTDGDDLLKSGIPLALVSIPLRYMHSSIEVGDWKDIQACIDLIAEFLMRMSADFEFRPLVPDK